jgi:hypothetical protein
MWPLAFDAGGAVSAGREPLAAPQIPALVQSNTWPAEFEEDTQPRHWLTGQYPSPCAINASRQGGNGQQPLVSHASGQGAATPATRMAATASAVSANGQQQEATPHILRPDGIGEAAYRASEPANPNPRHFATQHVSSALPPTAHQSFSSSHAMPANGQAGHLMPPAPPRRRSFLIRLEEEIEVCSPGSVDRLAEMCIVFYQSRGCHAGRRTSSRVQPAAAEEMENQPGGRRRGT